MLPDRTKMPTKRPKILLIENSLHVTGAFTSALAIFNALGATHDIEFVLPAKSTLRPVVEASGLVCHQLPMVELGRSWSRLIRYVPQLIINTLRLRHLLAQRHVNILVVNDYYNLLGAAARLTGWRGRLITIVRLMPLNQHRVLNRVWTALAIQISDKVIAVSQAVSRQMPVSNKVQVIYNPRQFSDEYSVSAKEISPDGHIRCLYLANYIAGKGHDIALDAFSKAYAANNALRLRFVGGDMGLEKNVALKLSLSDKARALGLLDVVSFHGFSDNVEREIKNSDIVLNFSESESFSNTCLEASAIGRPVVATRCGGPEEIIDDAISGVLVPVGNVNAMAEALIKLSRDGQLRQSMGKAGSIIIRERFSERAFFDAFEKLGLS